MESFWENYYYNSAILPVFFILVYSSADVIQMLIPITYAQYKLNNKLKLN